MAITGISAISGEQIIAAGAVSAKEAGKASFTTGGNDIQNLYDTVSINSASWENVVTSTATGVSYVTGISAINGTPLLATGVFNKGKILVGSSDPGMYLTGTHGTAYYKANELIINRTGYGEQIKFNLGSAGSQVIGSAAGTRGAFIDMSNASHEAFLGVRNDEDAKLELDGEVITPNKIVNYDSVYDTVNTYSGDWTGGSDVPEGVLVESGLEYNAVNEISGYSGSAFAQYGAEKQWLQHDDTLLHVANSAQYALGVNVSTVAQLMGVDKTVLWSGTAAPSNFPLTMSEPFSAFEKIEFVWDTRYNGDYGTPTKGTIVYTDNHGSTVPTKYTLVEPYANASQTWWDWWYLENDNNGTTLTNLKALYYPMTGGASATQTNCRLFKVVGINRTGNP
jgi:hypothetical protein